VAEVAYIDVDDTLIRSTGQKRIPMVQTVRYVRRLKQEGWKLYCWSSGGAIYAKEIAIELKIDDCFIGYLPKPEIMVDDLTPQEWHPFKIIHPGYINEHPPQ